jgi:hypothetical protein
MIYDVTMIALIVVSTAGVIWASRKINKAAKEGKLRVIGIVRKNDRKS